MISNLPNALIITHQSVFNSHPHRLLLSVIADIGQELNSYSFYATGHRGCDRVGHELRPKIEEGSFRCLGT